MSYYLKFTIITKVCTFLQKRWCLQTLSLIFFQCLDKDCTFPIPWGPKICSIYFESVFRLNALLVELSCKINVVFQHVWCVISLIESLQLIYRKCLEDLKSSWQIYFIQKYFFTFSQYAMYHYTLQTFFTLLVHHQMHWTCQVPWDCNINVKKSKKKCLKTIF